MIESEWQVWTWKAVNRVFPAQNEKSKSICFDKAHFETCQNILSISQLWFYLEIKSKFYYYYNSYMNSLERTKKIEITLILLP